jgi:putative spermidine/putrescine transport system permease protein
VLFLLVVFVSSMLLLFSYSLRLESSAQLLAPFDWATWQTFLTTPYNWQVVWTTLKIALEVVAFTLMVAYPTAWCMARMKRGVRLIIVVAVVFSPVLVSVVVRSYGWMLILAPSGLLSQISPVPLLYHEAGVVISLVHVVLPFAVFPILSVMGNLPADLSEAAADLGAAPFRRFRKVILPLTLPGVVSAAQIVFALTVSAFATPAILGGGRVQVLSQQIYSNISQLRWPLAAVESIVLLVIALVILMIFNQLNRRIDSSRKVVSS